MFGNKDKNEEDELQEEKRKEIDRLLNKTSGSAGVPDSNGLDFTSKAYKQFKKEEEFRKKKNLYEKMANVAGKLLHVSPSGDSKKDLQDKIDFCNLKVSPTDVISLSILAPLLLSSISMTLLVLGLIGVMMGFASLIGCVILFYYLYKYPSYAAKRYRIRMSSDIIMAVLYMSIFMKTTPNLEGAVNFAATNLSGPLAYELRELLWKVDIREYETMDEALADYSSKWKSDNEEFVESVQILRNCGTVSPERRDSMLDESVNVILDRSEERMKRYAQGLNTPVTAIYAMGILLPLIGLVMFPMLMIFLKDVVKPIFLAIGYDLLLPGILLWIIHKISLERPMAFRRTEISSYPNLPKKGCVRIFGKNIPVLPLAVIVFIGIASLGGYMMYNNYSIYRNCQQLLGDGSRPDGFYMERSECNAHMKDFFTPLLVSLIPLWGFVISSSIYLIFGHYQRYKIRNEVKNIEDQFPSAIFQLGNQISYGTSLESALEKATKKLNSEEMKEMYNKAVRNIKQMNLTFEGAFFDEAYGALKYYPSSLISNILRMVTSTMKKGVRMAGLTMLTISRYLKGVREVENEIRGMVSSTVSSMKFLAIFLAPVVSGVTVTMAVVILRILSGLGEQLSFGSEGVSGTRGLMSALPAMLTGLESGLPISPGMFQLVVGIYSIETTMILSAFASSLEEGNDPLEKKMSVGIFLLISMGIYTITVIFAYYMFGSTVTDLLSQGI
ncbi:MAG: hypothetical protein ABEK17_04675 [Candidatus Aenigmatarchaeota archaeon]